MNTLHHFYPSDALLLFSINLLIHVSVVALFTLVLARTLLRHRPAARHSVICCTVLYLLFGSVICQCAVGSGKAWITLSLPTSMRLPIVRQVVHPAGTGMTFSAPAMAMETSGASIVPMPANAEPFSRQASETLLPARFEEVWNRRSSALTVNLRPLASLLLLIWGGGLALGFVRLVSSWRQVARLRRGICPIDERDLEEVLMQVKRALRSQSLSPIASAHHLSGPLVVGVRRPLVILPEALLNRLNRSQLRDVLIHECAHVALRHPIEGLLQRIMEILFWPHPLVHTLGRELAQAREEVCDNFVLDQAEATHYARTLLAIAEGITSPQTMLPLALLPPRLRLEHRVAGLLNPKRNRRTRVVLWKSGVMLLVFHILGSVVAVRASEGQTMDTATKLAHIAAVRASEGQTLAPTYLDTGRVRTHIQNFHYRFAGPANLLASVVGSESYAEPASLPPGNDLPIGVSLPPDESLSPASDGRMTGDHAGPGYKIAGKIIGKITSGINNKFNGEINSKINEIHGEILHIHGEITNEFDRKGPPMHGAPARMTNGVSWPHRPISQVPISGSFRRKIGNYAQPGRKFKGRIIGKISGNKFNGEINEINGEILRINGEVSPKIDSVSDEMNGIKDEVNREVSDKLREINATIHGVIRNVFHRKFLPANGDSDSKIPFKR